MIMPHRDAFDVLSADHVLVGDQRLGVAHPARADRVLPPRMTWVPPWRPHRRTSESAAGSVTREPVHNSYDACLVRDRHDETSADEVAVVIDWMASRGAVYQVNGGWAVDALLGRQTRPHRDLDVFLDTDVVDELLDWLRTRGYVVVEDWRPIRVELAAPHGRIDVHPMAIQPNGDGIQEGMQGVTFLHAATDRTTGQIGGRPVTVATADRLTQLRRGYEPRAVDLHDLAVLRSLQTH